AAAGKHNLGGSAGQQFGHGFAGAFDGGARLLSMMVDGGRVAEALAKVRPHGLEDLGEHWGSRVVVKIGPAQHAAIVPRRGVWARVQVAANPISKRLELCVVVSL